MASRVLPEARADLREAIRHYRAVKPPALGKQLAARVRGSDVVVVAVEYATRDYVDRVTNRVRSRR